MPHALVVDDSSTVRLVLSSLLESVGWTSTAAADGSQAVALLEAGLVPDLLLTDRHMPHGDGLVVLRALRSRWTTRRVRALLVTADVDGDAVAQGLAAGADAVLAKPVDVARLLELLPEHAAA